MKHLRTLFFAIILFLTSDLVFAQIAETITVIRNKNGMFIEKNFWGRNDSYYLNNSSSSALIQSIKKSIEWYDLNLSHKKKFTKEINRLKVMDKYNYTLHGYITQFVIEMRVNFTGSSYGESFSVLELDGGGSWNSFITLNSRKQMEDFLLILEGKSANSGIDNIFKN